MDVPHIGESMEYICTHLQVSRLLFNKHQVQYIRFQLFSHIQQALEFLLFPL